MDMGFLNRLMFVVDKVSQWSEASLLYIKKLLLIMN